MGGNLVGNFLGLVVILVLGIVTWHSTPTGTVVFLMVAYAVWLLLYIADFVTRPSREVPLASLLSDAEFSVYRSYYTFLWAPGAGQLFSAFLNLLRLAGLIWAGLAFWKGNAWVGGGLIAYFFVVGSLCLRFDPIRYLGGPATSGHDVAQAQLALLQSVQEKRAAHMFSSFKKNKPSVGLLSLIAISIESEFDEKVFLADFGLENDSNWQDFEENGHNHKDLSVGLFIIAALKIFRHINSDLIALDVLSQSSAEKIFLECICFTCCAIPKLDAEEYLTNLYGMSGEFYKLDGADLILEKTIDLYAETPGLSFVHPQEIVDFWEDRVQYYNQLRKGSTDNFFKALCYLFSLAVRSHGDMPFKSVLDINPQDISLLTPPSPFSGTAIQDAAELALSDFIETAKNTMYGYQESDFK